MPGLFRDCRICHERLPQNFPPVPGFNVGGKIGRIVSLIFPFLLLLLLSLAEECGSLLVSGRASSSFIPAFERIPVRLSHFEECCKSNLCPSPLETVSRSARRNSSRYEA